MDKKRHHGVKGTFCSCTGEKGVGNMKIVKQMYLENTCFSHQQKYEKPCVSFRCNGLKKGEMIGLHLF